ncbi:cytochrome bd oxidase small subunit CydS [Lottiidibacillus patelloidae]
MHEFLLFYAPLLIVVMAVFFSFMFVTKSTKMEE